MVILIDDSFWVLYGWLRFQGLPFLNWEFSLHRASHDYSACSFRISYAWSFGMSRTIFCIRGFCTIYGLDWAFSRKVVFGIHMQITSRLYIEIAGHYWILNKRKSLNTDEYALLHRYHAVRVLITFSLCVQYEPHTSRVDSRRYRHYDLRYRRHRRRCPALLGTLMSLIYKFPTHSHLSFRLLIPKINYQRYINTAQSQFIHKSSTMEAQHGHSAACCNIPPVVSKGYEHKGKYETIGGLKTCTFFFTVDCSIASWNIYHFNRRHIFLLKIPYSLLPQLQLTHTFSRCHRPRRRNESHFRHLRYLRILPPNSPRRRHPGQCRWTQ